MSESKPGPKPKPIKKKTKLLRVSPDLAAQMAAVCRYLGITSSEFMDEVVRPAVGKKFDSIRPHLEQLAKQSATASKRLADVDKARAEAEAYLRQEQQPEPTSTPKPRKRKAAE
jgi:hypothetical protein